MSCDMIHLDLFFDASHCNLVAADDPGTCKGLQASFNGQDSIMTIPKFYMHHQTVQLWVHLRIVGIPSPALDFAKAILFSTTVLVIFGLAIWGARSIKNKAFLEPASLMCLTTDGQS
jgi:hypothetical protein